MRILQVGPIPPEVGGTTMGGVATHTWELATHLAQRGHDVAVLADNFPGPVERPVSRDGVRIYGFSISRSFLARHLIPLVRNLVTIVKLKHHFGPLQGTAVIAWKFCRYYHVLRDFQPDVVHVHHLEGRFPFAHYAARGRFPIAASVHSTTSVKFADSAWKANNLALLRRNAGLASDLVFGFPTRMNEFLSLLDADERASLRCWSVPYPMNASSYFPVPVEEARAKIGIPAGRPLVLFVGNLVPLKGALTLVEAVSVTKRRGGAASFALCVIGGGPQMDELRRSVGSLGLGADVLLLGPKRYPELLYYYNAADLFVTVSKEEALPTTAFEAMQCGCPILVSTNVAPELLPPSEFCRQVPVDDVEALAEGIAACLGQTWRRAALAEYMRGFDWDSGTRANTTNFENLYRQLVTEYANDR